MKRTCTACGKKLGEAKVVSHSALGIGGEYCNAECYLKDIEKRGNGDPRPKHADIETLVGDDKITR